MREETCDVAIIGAGPAGAIAAARLVQAGLKVLVLEREHFPRFSVGESLLPQSMQYLQEAGMLQAVVEAGFQYKNGARFVQRDRDVEFDFRDKFSAGWGTTYQVQRAPFDHLLAQCAQAQGAEIRYGYTVSRVQPDPQTPRLWVRDAAGTETAVQARHILDASGFGRVLQRMLKLEIPSGFPSRAALFTHVQDNLSPMAWDRSKILIAVHPEQADIWYWLIPFPGGRCSLGVVGRQEVVLPPDDDNAAQLGRFAQQEPNLKRMLAHGTWDTPVRRLVNYSANVESLVGPGYTLLGNAGEFLDPVFSSGVTIALKSASMASACLARQLRGEAVDWQADFETPLRAGISVFRCFVDMWYGGGLQRIIFHAKQPVEIRRMIASILAGYVWDKSNPFVAHTQRRMAALETLCSQPEVS